MYLQERLIQLKEQRVRLEQPGRVRRSRSASTRTQSIRRTSLREKMNTTKKDVQDEKLYFIQSFDAMPKIEPVRRVNLNYWFNLGGCSDNNFKGEFSSLERVDLVDLSGPRILFWLFRSPCLSD